MSQNSKPRGMRVQLPSSTPIRGLLRCLDAAPCIICFEEEGYTCLGDLREADREEVTEFVAALCMKRDGGKRLLAFAFPDEDTAASGDITPDADAAEAAALPRCGRAFDGAWLEAVEPLYSLHMGCENMGPLLYSLVRFVKPAHSLEIGAGYTSAFLLQALEDNAAEARCWRQWGQKSRQDYLVAPHAASDEAVDPSDAEDAVALPRTDEAVLHCVDNWAHEHSTAPKLLAVANRLGIERRLRLHVDEARAFLLESEGLTFDFVWLDGLLDFAPPVGGSGPKAIAAGIDAFLGELWPRVAPGGFVLVHSTLTNTAVRGWLEGVGDAAWGPPGAVFSLLEPHKRFQNSVTLLQRRPPGYGEPIHSTLP